MPVDVQMKWYDVWGTEQTYNHMSAGWSWAFDTPFDWFKQNASRLGGINQNMVVSWPARIKDKGGLREQFVHVIDVVPTILEAAGIRAPEMVDGIKQAPIEGTSFAYTFDAKNAKAPSRHKTQYFEMMGQWALYDDGWLLSTKVNRAPWEAFGPANPDPLNNQVLRALRPEQGLQPDRRHRREEPAEGQGDEGRSSSPRPRSTRSSRWTPRWRPASSRRARTSPPAAREFVYTRPMVGLPQGDSPLLLNTLLHDHRRHRRAAGRRRGHDPDLGRALRRLRLLPAQGQAGVPVEPGRSGAHQVGRPRRADARAGTRSSSTSSTTASAPARSRSTTSAASAARHRHAQGGRQGRSTRSGWRRRCR